jgi:hypothetical protein
MSQVGRAVTGCHNAFDKSISRAKPNFLQAREMGDSNRIAYAHMRAAAVKRSLPDAGSKALVLLRGADLC